MRPFGDAEESEGFGEDVLAMPAKRHAIVDDELDDASDGAGVWRGIQSSGSMPTADALYQLERSWESVPGVIERINGAMAEFSALMAQVFAPAARPQVPDRLPAPLREG